jgi:hypothetical protein
MAVARDARGGTALDWERRMAERMAADEERVRRSSRVGYEIRGLNREKPSLAVQEREDMQLAESAPAD